MNDPSELLDALSLSLFILAVDPFLVVPGICRRYDCVQTSKVVGRLCNQHVGSFEACAKLEEAHPMVGSFVSQSFP